MFETDHPVYPQLQKIGREITQKIKPRAVVVFSAHWQAGRNKIEVNEAEVTSLIYECVPSPSPPHRRQQLIVAGVGQLLRLPGSLLQSPISQRGLQGFGTEGTGLAQECGYRGRGCQARVGPWSFCAVYLQ
jgi:4,5-DOPA dioxygenase extradiol